MIVRALIDIKNPSKLNDIKEGSTWTVLNCHITNYNQFVNINEKLEDTDKQIPRTIGIPLNVFSMFFEEI